MILSSVILAATVAVAQSSTTSVIVSGARLEKVWADGEFTEGGARAIDGSILFSDIGNRIMRFDPKTNKTTVFREPSGRANGMMFDKNGHLIIAEGANTGGGRRVSITEPSGTVRTLADSYGEVDVRRFNSPNDVAVDSQGRVYVSDPRYVGNEPRELDFEGVFLIQPTGFVIRLDVPTQKPNGLVISPDGKTLYIADNGPRQHVLIATTIGDRGKVDGRIVAAGGGEKTGVYIFSPAGKLLEIIHTPESPANVEFGGDDFKTLYICAGKSLYRIKTTMTGYHLWPPMPPKP